MHEEAVVASFRAVHEAEAAVAALAREGIDARIATGEAQAIAAREGLPFLGIGVLVAREREEEAKRILEPLFGGDAGRPEVERCPSCGSTSFTRPPRLAIFAVATVIAILGGFFTHQMPLFMLTLGIVAIALLATPNRRCTNCGERWRGRWIAAEEEPVETPDVPCPRCGSTETVRIDRRKLRAITLAINVAVPPFFVFWPLLPKRRCENCGNEWR